MRANENPLPSTTTPRGFNLDAAQFIRAIRTQELPSLAVQRAVDAVTDTAGCMVLGARQPLETPLRRALFGAPAQRTVEATLRRVLAPSTWADSGPETQGAAVLYLGALAHAADYDDISHPAYCHATALLLPPLLVRGVAGGHSGDSLVRAYIAGVETMGQLGRSLNTRHYETGWHATSTIGTLAATAALAVLDGLSESQTITALGIAASLASGVRQNFGSMTKPLHAGLPGRSAILATRLAREGFTSSADAIDGRYGFCRTFGGNAEPGHAKPWGGPLEILTDNGLALKAYPCCAATHAAVDAARVLSARHTPGQVRSIRVAVSRFAMEPLIYLRPVTPLEAKFCMPYCVAAAFVDGRLDLESFNTHAIVRPDIVALMEHTVMEVDARVADDREFASIVELTLADGSVDSVRVDVASGKPGKWMSPSDLEAKFVSCCGQPPQDAGTRKLYAAAQALPMSPSPADLYASLVDSIIRAADSTKTMP
jgi:2-methylcitrate dehydratase PrpD